MFSLQFLYSFLHTLCPFHPACRTHVRTIFFHTLFYSNILSLVRHTHPNRTYVRTSPVNDTHKWTCPWEALCACLSALPPVRSGTLSTVRCSSLRSDPVPRFAACRPLSIPQLVPHAQALMSMSHPLTCTLQIEHTYG